MVPTGRCKEDEIWCWQNTGGSCDRSMLGRQTNRCDRVERGGRLAMPAISSIGGPRWSIRGAKHDARRPTSLSALRRDEAFVRGVDTRQRAAMALPRKLRRRTPRRWAECPDDLHDYTNRVAPRRASRRSREDDGPIVVTDDWPEHVPIGDAELRAIEGHMRHELDKLFGPLP